MTTVTQHDSTSPADDGDDALGAHEPECYRAGVGGHRDGDEGDHATHTGVVEIEAEGIGRLVNGVEDEA